MSLFPKPDRLPTGQEVEAVAVAMAATVGLLFHTLDDDSRFRLRVMASAALLRIGLDAKPALGDRELVRQLEGIAGAVEALVRALDLQPDHGVPDVVVANAQRAATVARTFQAIVLAADLPETPPRPLADVVRPGLVLTGNVVHAESEFGEAPDLLADADPEGYAERAAIFPPAPENDEVIL